MPKRLSRGARVYIRRRKAEIRRSSDNPDAAIESLMRSFTRPTPTPTPADGAVRERSAAPEASTPMPTPTGEGSLGGTQP